MRVLVIGGTGFIGRRIVEKLISMGHKAIIMDIRVEGLPSRLMDKTDLVCGDIRIFSDLIQAIVDHKIETIINAAYMLTSDGESNPHMASQVNCQGMCNVFEAARICGIRRVVFCSSVAAYAHQHYYGERLVTEDEELMKPATIYGSAKVFNEFIASRFEKKYGIEIPSIRISPVYGSGREDRGVTAWASNMVSCALKGAPAIINMRSRQISNFIYVDDAAEQLVRLCLAERLNHRVYNSGGVTFTPSDFLKILNDYFPNAEITFNEKALEWPYPYLINGSRIENEIGVSIRGPVEVMGEMVEQEKTLMREQ